MVVGFMIITHLPKALDKVKMKMSSRWLERKKLYEWTTSCASNFVRVDKNYTNTYSWHTIIDGATVPLSDCHHTSYCNHDVLSHIRQYHEDLTLKPQSLTDRVKLSNEPWLKCSLQTSSSLFLSYTFQVRPWEPQRMISWFLGSERILCSFIGNFQELEFLFLVSFSPW